MKLPYVDSPVPCGANALAGTVPVWKTKPGWYWVVTDDKLIPAPAAAHPAKNIRWAEFPGDFFNIWKIWRGNIASLSGVF